MIHFENTRSYAQQLDKDDPLKYFRNRFIIPSVNGKEQIYFLGNSLGLQPKNAKEEVDKVFNQWAAYGVEGFFKGGDPWINYHDQLIHPLSKIVGALPQEISVMNQLTVNLHLMMVSFYQPKGKSPKGLLRRNKIICEAKAFPSDQYMFETHLKHYGLDPANVIIEIHPRKGEHITRLEDILDAIAQHKEELALVLWGGLNYYTGQFFDMKAITSAAQKAGAKVGFDLAHAAGNVPLQLHNWNVDFACWCSYKYLNAGPGAVAAVFIHERHHHDNSIPRYAGWWGYDKVTRFKMEKGFRPMPGAEGWQLSTPSYPMYALHKASLEIFEAAGWEAIQKKQKQLTAYLWYLLNAVNKTTKDPIIEFITPQNEQERGCQVSMLMLERGKEIFDTLSTAGVMVDWREPNVIRLAPVPLYNTYEELWRFANILKEVIED